MSPGVNGKQAVECEATADAGVLIVATEVHLRARGRGLPSHRLRLSEGKPLPGEELLHRPVM